MTSAGSLPDARFHSEQFRRSVMEAFLSGDFNTSPPAARKTKSLQQTVFDESYFRRSVEHSIQAADFELSRAVKAPTNSVPVTGFDAYQFDLSVEQSLRSGDFRGPNTPRKKKLSVATGRALSTPLQGKMVAANSDQMILGGQQQMGPTQLSPPVRSNDLKKKPSPDTLNNKPPIKEELPQTFDHATGQAPSYHYNDFSPMPVDPASVSFDPVREAWPYDAKADVYTQHPLVEYPRKWYGNGITPRGIDWFGHKNLVRPQFYIYGDYRVGIQGGRNANGRADNVSARLNLDLDLRLTDTERFHAFFGPLDKNGEFSRIELVEGKLELENEFDLNPATGFFEGDLGVILGASQNRTAPFDLPFTAGLVPLVFQNGIWLEDAASGAAFAIPAFSSRLLNWSNADATFFALFDQINSPAFSSNHSAQAFGTAWFIEAYDGYIETGYAYLNDRNFDERDYHNITFSYTRRYFDRISNSVRVIVNAGQDGDRDDRTADGTLLLVENSWITAKPLTVVPYANFFVGWDRPQSVARAGGSGGVLRNTGLNFQSDGLNGFSFLDDSGNDTAGGAIGVDLIGDQLDRQLILEAAWQTSHGSLNRNVSDDQFAVGARWQYNFSNATLLRFDTMYGWRRGLEDIYGTRLEYRWKF